MCYKFNAKNISILNLFEKKLRLMFWPGEVAVKLKA